MKLFRSLICLLAVTSAVYAQVANVSVSRQKWLSQATLTNGVPLSYRVEAAITGIGIQQAEFYSPAITNAMSGSTIQRTFSTNFASVSVSTNTTSTNSVSSGLTNFNASFPTGAYRIYSIVATTNALKKVTLNTNTWTVNMTNTFPVDPLITNVVPFTALVSTQNFIWPRYTTNANAGYIEFYVLEGTFDTNTLWSISTNGSSAITNFTLVANNARLSATATNVALTNVNASLDHIAMLAFHLTGGSETQLPNIQADASTTSLCLYLATRASGTNQISLSITNSTNTVTVTWSTNASTNLVLTGTTSLKKPALNRGSSVTSLGIPVEPEVPWIRLTNRVSINVRGEFEVTIPAVLPMRIFRLESQ